MIYETYTQGIGCHIFELAFSVARVLLKGRAPIGFSCKSVLCNVHNCNGQMKGAIFDHDALYEASSTKHHDSCSKFIAIVVSYNRNYV